MKDIVSLRNHLFDQLNRLAEAQTTEEIDQETNRAASIVQVSEAIIKSAETENQFIAITKGFGSGFIPVINDRKSLVEIISTKVKQSNIAESKAEEKEEKEEKVEMFDVDKEKNWLKDDPP